VNSELKVGQIWRSTQLSDADRRVILVTSDKEVMKVLKKLKVVRCYPDTTDENGNFNSTFKIEVEADE